MSKLLTTALLTILFSHISVQAAFLSNGFLVTSQFIAFEDKPNKCYGKIFYPKLSNENKSATLKINSTINDFIKNYKVQCAKKTQNVEYKVNYDVRKGKGNYFSVRWTTKINDPAIEHDSLKIETLNFNMEDGRLLSEKDILSPLAKNFMPEIIKLSQNNLAADTSWKQFLKKISIRSIQLYVLEDNWSIVFNPGPNNRAVTEAKLPSYFISK